MELGYTTLEVSRILDIPLTTLHYWDADNFIRSGVRRWRGRKWTRLYSFRDILAAKLVRGYQRDGLHRDTIRPLIDYIRTGSETALAAEFLVMIAGKVYECRGEKDLSQTLGTHPAGLTLVVTVNELVGEVQERLLSAAATPRAKKLVTLLTSLEIASAQFAHSA